MTNKKNKVMECSNCGSTAKVIRGSYPFKESGLAKNVVLCGIDLIKCPDCGNVDPVIPRINDLMRLLALAVIGQPYRLQGEDVKFLRKFLGKTGDEFCQLLHINKSTLSKWENNEDPVGASNDRLIRAITLGLDAGLNKELAWVINSFPKIGDEVSHKSIEIDTDKMSYQYA